MSLTIMYRHPQRPDEAGMVVVPDKAKAAEMKDQLENRGFLIIEIATAPFARATINPIEFQAISPARRCLQEKDRNSYGPERFSRSE